MTEAEITINGERLTLAQAMTMRVALTQFLEDVSVEGSLGTDSHGLFMRAAYIQAGVPVLELMAGNSGSIRLSQPGEQQSPPPDKTPR